MPEEELSLSRSPDQNTTAEAEPGPPGSRPRSPGGTPPTFEPSRAEISSFLARVLQAYPYLQRHPHPFLVHFAIVFIYAATFLSLLFLVVGSPTLETAAFYCVGAGLLVLPPVMFTGEISRRVNYAQQPKELFTIEIQYSRVLLALWAGAFLWRWCDPTILTDFRWLSRIYLLLLLSGVVIVTLISYYGGLLTFPLEKEEGEKR
jgi:uncharacterized membrane protein